MYTEDPQSSFECGDECGDGKVHRGSADEGMSMGKTRSGSVRRRNGSIYARISFTDDESHRREVWRKAENKTHAKALINDLLRTLDDHGKRALDGANMTFKDLADEYERNALVPPK
jgi:hypothetical protein